MKSNQTAACLIIGFLLGVIVFVMINLTFNTAIFPSLVSDLILPQVINQKIIWLIN
jgi:hypothetical protein